MLFTLLAVLSKETGIVLPLFCACWDLATTAAAAAPGPVVTTEP